MNKLVLMLQYRVVWYNNAREDDRDRCFEIDRMFQD